MTSSVKLVVAVRYALTCVVAALGYVSIVATGGGGDAGGGTPAPGSSVPAATPRTVVASVATSVPLATSKAIVAIDSAAGSSAPGSTVPLPNAGKTDDLLVARDSNNQVLLLAVAQGNVQLNAETTAIALVRLAFGVMHPDEGYTAAQLTNAIKNAAGYPQLLNAVNVALSTGAPVMDSDDVALASLLVSKQVKDSLAATADSGGTPKSIASASDLTLPLPYYFIDQDGTSKLWIQDAPRTSVALLNQTRLQWRVLSQDKNGGVLQDTMIDPLTANLASLLGYYKGTGTKKEIVGSDEFYVTVEQTAATRAEAALRFVQKSMLVMLKVVIPKGVIPDDLMTNCAKSVAESILNSKLAALVAQPTGDSLLTYVKSTLKYDDVDPNFIYKKLKACTSFSDVVKGIKENSPLINAVANYWKKLETVRDGAEVLDLAFSARHWNTSQTAHVCKVDGTVRACAVKVEGSYSRLEDLPPTATFPFRITTTETITVTNGTVNGTVVVDNHGSGVCASLTTWSGTLVGAGMSARINGTGTSRFTGGCFFTGGATSVTFDVTPLCSGFDVYEGRIRLQWGGSVGGANVCSFSGSAFKN